MRVLRIHEAAAEEAAESGYVFRPTKFAMAARELQKDYDRVFKGA